MCQEPRLYLCQRCLKQVIICSDCDRGNIYCGSDCAKQARQESVQRARIRYAKSSKGKLKQARRQKQYRQRQSEKLKNVTDQGSTETPPHDVLPDIPMDSPEEPLEPMEQGPRCHFCYRLVSKFVRYDFIHRASSPSEPHHQQIQCQHAQAP